MINFFYSFNSLKGENFSIDKNSCSIFNKNILFDPSLLKETLEAKSYLHKGLKITFKDGTTGQTHQFVHEQGIQEYLAKLVKDRGRKPTAEFVFYVDRKLNGNGNDGEGFAMEVALQWTDEPAAVSYTHLTLPTIYSV